AHTSHHHRRAVFPTGQTVGRFHPARHFPGKLYSLGDKSLPCHGPCIGFQLAACSGYRGPLPAHASRLASEHSAEPGADLSTRVWTGISPSVGVLSVVLRRRVPGTIDLDRAFAVCP